MAGVCVGALMATSRSGPSDFGNRLARSRSISALVRWVAAATNSSTLSTFKFGRSSTTAVDSDVHG